MDKKGEIIYHREIDLNDKNTVYYKILEEIKPETKILEVGCSTGYFTKILKEHYNCVVDCIEIDKEATKKAEQYCNKIIVADVEELNFADYFEKEYFDTIVLADVLEHLKQPEKVLENIREYLKDDGFLLISIPNITHASISLSLLDGKWEYKPIGLLDETHLRFFTKESFIKLLEDKGYCPLKIKRVIVNPRDTEFKTPYDDYPVEVRNYIEKRNLDYNTYQFVFKVIKFNEKTNIIKAYEEKREIQNKLNRLTEEKNLLLQQLENIKQEKIQLEEKINLISLEKNKLQEQIEILKKDLNNTKEEKNNIINELTKTKELLLEKEFIITEIQTSLLWKIASFYRNIIEKILPQGTKRRKFYSLFNLGLKVLFKDGKKEFKNKTVKYIKKSKSKNPDLPDFPEFEKNFHKLEFPVYENPEFSIIIPVYNKAIYTFNCLKSILKNTNIPYEVIVIDDCSNDETEKMMDFMKNCVYIRNEKNKGFVESCNTGAKNAKGNFLLFLNNDTIVTKNWLENILKIFDRFNDAGIVGVKLVFPDGKLQEAGSIIFSDGSCWNYGKFDNPSNPEYNYIKKVDYCSGACITLKKEIFEKVNGFDDIFKPAYYEDTDLSMKIREIGLNVYYQPFSIVYHFEGITSGTDINKGIKKFQEINKNKFLEKWKDTLSLKHYPPKTPLFIARERVDKGRILVIDHYVPSHDKDSGSLRMFSILKLLSKQGWKIVFWPDNLAKIEPYTSDLQWLGIEVIYGNQNFHNYIKENGKFFDYIFLSRPHISKNYIDLIKLYSDATVIYDTVDLHYLREERRAKIENDPNILEEAKNWKNIEFYLCKKSDIVITITEKEKDILKKEFNNKDIRVIPNVHDPVTYIKPFEERKDLMFIGSFLHPPNIDAVVWFANDIFPEIKKELPMIKFYIIGTEPTEEVKKLQNENIIVTGYVKDVHPYFQNCKVFVSPLRYGAGLKGKIGQSMSFGLPVVTTSIGAEGFITEDTPFIIADDKETFVKSVIELYNNKELWDKLSNAGLETIKKYYSFEAIEKILEEIFVKEK